jgi:hypothetical protein
MLSIEKSNGANVYIKGEFWDFDRLYFAITRLVGDFGRNGRNDICPFPGYDAVCESLLGLNYELRHAMQGDRELHEQFSGIPDHWFSDAGGTANNGSHDPELADDDDEEYEDEDDEEYEEYEEYSRNKLFLRSDYPHAGSVNTWLQFQIPIAEALYYALIIRELFPKKHFFVSYYWAKLNNDGDALQDLNEEYYYCRLKSDLSRLTIFMEGVFRVLYHLIGKKKYVRYMDLFSSKPEGFLRCDLHSLNNLVMDYGLLDAVDASATIVEFLDKFYSMLDLK